MKINGKSIEDFLKGKSIVKVYYGKDNWCRCGCGGHYFEQGDVDFDTALHLAFQRFNSMRCSSNLVLNSFQLYEPEGKHEGYINIPCYNNQCYCIYYK